LREKSIRIHGLHKTAFCFFLGGGQHLMIYPEIPRSTWDDNVRRGPSLLSCHGDTPGIGAEIDPADIPVSGLSFMARMPEDEKAMIKVFSVLVSPLYAITTRDKRDTFAAKIHPFTP
jgi:hypothetical protein